ncbi:MAG TPA: leucyl aminopeptidase [Blastocatellia bacterium]|nr:leucyl aminopeptidase [Blastocatellia bacterium]
MEVRADSGMFYDVEADALVVTIYEGDKADEGVLRELDERSNGIITELLAGDEMRGKQGDMVYVYRPGNFRARRLLLVGGGKRDDYSFNTIRKITGSAARFLRSKGARSMAILRRSQLDLGPSAQAAVEGALMALFEPDMYKTENKEERRIDELILVAATSGSEEALARGVECGRIIGEAVNYARQLSNEPGSTLTPSELAEQARETATRYGLDIDVLDEARMKELGMGALLGVARGSDEPAKLIVLRYMPDETEPLGNDQEIIAIVGKGITFDSGGISIKPAENMEKMKYDMSGASATLAAMRAIAQLKPRVNVIGLMPSSENLPSGRAYKPGDVLRAMSGKTIEVINTDAEGRVILADAISYARRLGATRIIDLATLTGACAIALGTVNAAILGNDQAFIDEVRQAGREVGERLWQLPMDEEYRDMIKSDIADIKNSAGRYAGTITAAYFLREFAEDTPWVHLDIAGTAWENERKPYIAKGPTGIGIRTLINYVCNHAVKEG